MKFDDYEMGCDETKTDMNKNKRANKLFSERWSRMTFGKMMSIRFYFQIIT